MKTVGKKYAGGAASKAGGQTEEYVKDNHEELEAQATQEYDDVKARAEAGLDDAKQVNLNPLLPCFPARLNTIYVDVGQNISLLRLALDSDSRSLGFRVKLGI
jgi:hypothetical protein